MTNIDPILDGFSDAELTAALDDRKAQRAANEKARKESVTLRWRYTLTRNTDPYYNGKVWDDSIEVWKLEGVCVNKDLALAVGHSESDIGPRSHSYLFNRCTGKFVMAEGGGYILASCGQAFTEMEYLLNGSYASGTDFVVTSIIDDHYQCSRGIGGFGKQGACDLIANVD